jgi:protein-S-isoprenylcysteine O-methyltransferase Ste14
MALTGAAGAVGGLYVLAALRGWFQPAGYWVPSGLAWALAAFFGLSLPLTFWGKATLGPYFAAGSALKVEHSLVTEGPYARIRHPIYTGMIIMCISTGVLSGMWLVLALGAGLAPICYGLRIWLDERLLQTGFGPTHTAYAHQVPLLMPRVWSAKHRA